MTEIGEGFGSRCTLTAEDLDLAVALTRGRHPVHVDEAAARGMGLRGRIFHGAVSAAVMAAAIGQRFSDQGAAILELSSRFRAPVYPGDTVESRWTVVANQDGRRQGQFMLLLSGELRNQHGEVVVEGTAKVLLQLTGVSRAAGWNTEPRPSA